MTLTPDDPKLTAYALGELDATERAAIEATLARSPECRRAVAEIQALTSELTFELAREVASTPLTPVSPVGRDSVEPHFERSEASAASISDAGEEARFARASSVGSEGSTESRPTGAFPSLAPIGGEGRGEGASRDAHSNATAFPSHQELHASAATNEGTPADSARLSPSPRPSPPVGAREKSNADAPGEGKVLFLPWRHWQTLGMAAAAALVVGFFVTKAWQGKQPERMVKLPESTSLPLLNQSSNHAPPILVGTNLISRGITNTAVFEYSTNGIVVVEFSTANGTAVAGTDSTARNSYYKVDSSALSPDSKTVIGGGFTTYNGTVTHRNVRLKVDGTLDTSFDPETRRLVVLGDGNQLNTAKANPVPGANNVVYSVAVSPAIVPSSQTPVQYHFAAGNSGVKSDDVLALGQTHSYYRVVTNNSFSTHLGWAFQPDTRTTAAYPRYVENPFTLVASEPLSTFSTDVDTASYANVRRFLNNNRLPPGDAVRIEELLNYFTYDYAPPTGEHPFAAHVEIAGCPWAPAHRLVRVGLKGREIKADKRPPSNFVFLIDVSGSMQPAERLPLLKQALRMLVKKMNATDRVGIVVYASEAGVKLPSTSCEQKERILSVLEALEAGGSTNGGEGIQQAYALAQANFIPGGVNRVILCTDGDFNVGITDQGQLVQLIEAKAKSGIFLTTLGVGTDNLKDALMQRLADKGNGNYHYLDSVEEGHKVLVEQMNATLVTIAKDVKIQIEFNPAQASAYRLIGYEKRIMAKQDFNNDAKDAGEIGAGHTVTALYEVVPPGVAVRGEVDPLKYQPPPAAPAPVKGVAMSKELLTLKLRYKAPDGDKSTLMEIPVTDSGTKLARASADFKFASAVASFGMVLKDSPFKGTATLESAQELAQEGKGEDTQGYRAEFINLLAKAKALKQ